MSTNNYTGKIVEGRYRVQQLLGKGGMGSVFQGEHMVIGKRVAVKFLHAEFAGNEDVVKRFYREAQAAAAIGHKNIIDVMDVGISDLGEPYMVMEYLEGESLSSMLNRAGPIDMAAACGILEPALLALFASHEKGIVHRDLKPENIFLVHRPDQPPAVKLIDFGISKFTLKTGQSQLTQTGSLLGTPAYMSAEQARGASEIDHRTDIYAMGVILYEMLTGELPFTGAHYNELLIKILTESPRPPIEVYPDFPPEAEALVLRTLSNSPKERPQTALEFLEEIKKLESFNNREERLTHFAASITKTSFAGGDLGESISTENDGSVASALYDQMINKATPAEWSETTAPSKRRLGAVIGLVIIIAVALGIVIGSGLLSKDSDSSNVVPVNVPVSTPKQEPDSSEPVLEGVSIEVKGVPDGAKIYYENNMILNNPFRVKEGHTIAALRVEAEGYEPYRASLTPSEDRVIEVSMTSLPKEKEEVEEDKTSKSNRDKKRPPKKPRDKKPENIKEDDKYVQGSRGTEIAEDFE